MEQNSESAVATQPTKIEKIKPIVVGIYGISGCGKSHLIKELRTALSVEDQDCPDFEYYDGSAIIARVTEGGLAAFQAMSPEKQNDHRKLAIDAIRQECADTGRIGVVAGHYMLYSDERQTPEIIATANDLSTFTHILYLDVPAETVAQRRRDDQNKQRGHLHVNRLQDWKVKEQKALRTVCRENNILFSILSGLSSTLVTDVSTMLRDFQRHAKDRENSKTVEEVLKEWIRSGPERLETAMVLDGDKTLAPHDTGVMFWQAAKTMEAKLVEDNEFRSLLLDDVGEGKCPLKTLFSGPLGHSELAFRQAVLMYEEIADPAQFDAICEQVASQVTMYPEFVKFLQVIAETTHARAIVATCGLAHVWNKVLRNHGLSESVRVIGGGRLSDGYVVTAEIKRELVSNLQKLYNMEVFAFGDSPLDLPMLREAHPNKRFIVVGDEKIRSKSMEDELRKDPFLSTSGYRQILLPGTVKPRFTVEDLPVTQLDNEHILEAVHRRQRVGTEFLLATEETAMQLSTAMRNADNGGPVLREAHRRAGWYLATEYVHKIVGIEKYDIPHTQGGTTDGWRLRNEKKTTIVALMRGGEPMAFGVSDAFPRAYFVHAKEPVQLKPEHVMSQKQILLVDSVVNNGDSVVEFVEHIRSMDAYIRVVVITGVIQAQSIGIVDDGHGSSKRGGKVGSLLEEDPNVSVIALRQSKNKYTGKGGTDTGHRLFNTTHMD
ncbi:PRTase-like protein [Venturia nashicola]|uniref:PRTase-like protein n=1 Tax=Venturia nashicola TaxID=86259 RepID=A0A4Z1P2I4_9PEZI|nr:PRTase-like protein [Venturia nashicola]TLD27906.1 PRTase-like protein [Venturia nashicola]